MGLFSSLSEPFTGMFNSATNLFSSGKGGKTLGSTLNNITGTTSSANLQQKYNLINGAVNQGYALQSAALNHAYQKEFAQNAHQWEVEDLKRAGLNPVLSAGGSGASASGGGVSSGATSGAGLASSGINPLEAILNGVATMTTAKRTNAETANIQADRELKTMQTLLIGAQTAQQPEVKRKLQKEAGLLAEQITNTQAKTAQAEAEAELTKQEAQWNKEHPTAYSIKKYADAFGDVTNTAINLATKIYGAHELKTMSKALTQKTVQKKLRQKAERLFKKR